MADHLDDVRQAAKLANWEQVAQNGGPPCFYLEGDDYFCLRAERWAGHGVSGFHSYLSFDKFIELVIQRAREQQ